MQIEHNSDRVTSLLETFFTAQKNNVIQAIQMIERAGYHLEYNAELLEQM